MSGSKLNDDEMPGDELRQDMFEHGSRMDDDRSKIRSLQTLEKKIRSGGLAVA